MLDTVITSEQLFQALRETVVMVGVSLFLERCWGFLSASSLLLHVRAVFCLTELSIRCLIRSLILSVRCHSSFCS